jgi:glycosyltransferase involved in cell wall biosynthesis
VAGDGALRTAFEAEARTIPELRVHMLGFLNQTEIGRAYAMADCLILPSRRGAGETWGLVVNEAMQFGLPAIVSDGVGCHPDLIREGETGFSFPSGSVLELAQRLEKIATQSMEERVRLGESAQRQIAAFSLAVAVNGLGAAIRVAANR